MCTAIVGYDPGARVPLLLAGVRDELVDRAWRPPARHWPDHPALIGGRDELAGGTWLALDPSAPRVACVLNGVGTAARVAMLLEHRIHPYPSEDWPAVPWPPY